MAWKVIIVEDVKLELKGTEEIFRNEIPEAEVIGTAMTEDEFWPLMEKELPDRVRAVRVESVPFAEYRKLMLGSDVILDQLYSYTPAMNALEAMAQGLVVVGGGEPENYAILGEESLRPIINVEPDEESVYEALRDLALHPERLPRLKADTLAYIHRHHDHLKVAQQYLDFWTKEK